MLAAQFTLLSTIKSGSRRKLTAVDPRGIQGDRHCNAPNDDGTDVIIRSDIAKIVGCPVIHVNGDHPEDVLRACKLAMDYRVHFQKDVLVDLIAFVDASGVMSCDSLMAV